MEKQAAAGTVWSRLVWALTLTLIISGWGLLVPFTSESGTFSFQGTTVESLGDDLFRVRHICTSSGIPGVLPPGCYSGAIRVNPSNLTLQLVEGGEDSPPSSSGSGSGSSNLEVEGTITSINATNAGGVTEFTVLGEGGVSGVRVQMNSTGVAFEGAPPGFGLSRQHIAVGQFVKAKGNAFGSTAGIGADEVVEVEKVEVKGPITGKTLGGTFNGVALGCTLSIFSATVDVLVPTSFNSICSASIGTVVEAEGAFVDTDGNGKAQAILAGEIKDDD